jgi:osmotically-inducible protein OsmY
MLLNANSIRSHGSRLCILTLSCVLATQNRAQETRAPNGDLQQITVTARRVFQDQEVTQRVAAALHADPYILDDHVTITTKDGVVTLHGLALDNWDVIQMKRLIRKMPGVRQVVDNLDVLMTGD